MDGVGANATFFEMVEGLDAGGEGILYPSSTAAV